MNIFRILFPIGSNSKFKGIRAIRHKGMYTLEPVFFLLAFICLLPVQIKLISEYREFLLILFYLFQLFFIVAAEITDYLRDMSNRTYVFFLFLLFSFLFLSGLWSFHLYIGLFVMVLLSSMLYRVRRTAFVVIVVVVNIFVVEHSPILSAVNNKQWAQLANSIPVYALVTNILAGLIISIFMYYLEHSTNRTNMLVQTIENNNQILQKEKETARHYRNALAGNELKFKTIVEYAFDGIVILDSEGNSKFISNSTEKITGFSSEEFQEGAINYDRIHPGDRQRVIENFRNIMNKRILKSTIYFRYLHKNNEWRNLEVVVSNLTGNSGIEGILFVFRDVTEHTRAEQRARYFEYYDQLTGLPNQLMFAEKIDGEIERAAARNRSFAVMCLGINRFKDINGQYGTNFGDLVLKQIGSRLKSNFRGDDFISRMMGDKFLILFSDMKSENDVIAIVRKTMDSFDTPFWVENRDISISASIGISVFPHDGLIKDELIKNSETALYICKESRKQKYAMFNKTQNEELIRRIQIEKEIFSAIEKKAFTVYLQPKVNPEGIITGAEALVRWFHGERGMISPGEFIPISERNRSIIKIGKIIVEKTFSAVNEWKNAGLQPVEISINVAPLQFSDPSFIDFVAELQQKYVIEKGDIEFEITETGIMENEAHTMEIMESLINLGFSISIDDFGTGYSSLNKLKDYPVSALKIDKSFIDPIPGDSSADNIVRTIIELAHSLHYKVVAEGVEKKEQLEFLSAAGCDMIQGYYFHKPMPVFQFEKLLKKSRQ